MLRVQEREGLIDGLGFGRRWEWVGPAQSWTE